VSVWAPEQASASATLLRRPSRSLHRLRIRQAPVTRPILLPA
jgi:hypothetical protein